MSAPKVKPVSVVVFATKLISPSITVDVVPSLSWYDHSMSPPIVTSAITGVVNTARMAVVASSRFIVKFPFGGLVYSIYHCVVLRYACKMVN